MPEIRATHCACEGWEAGRPVIVRHEDGIVTAVEPDEVRAGERRRLLLPALANAHDHARPIPLSSFGAVGMPLETWLPRSMLATPPDAYLASAAPLARAARSGAGAVMIHYTRPSGLQPIVDEARDVARAARDVGVRIAFALAVRDINPLVYGDETELLNGLPAEMRDAVAAVYLRAPPRVEELIETYEAVAEAIAGPMVDVQYGPAGVQWCSTSLLEAVAERSAATGRRVHMHLLETPYQRAYADRTFPQGVVRHLRDIGLLSDRLSLAHCIHARPDELELIAEAGATIVVNSSSNLHLRSGLIPLERAVALGCRIAVGMDGLAFDEDDDIVRETRLAYALHAGSGFRETFSRADFLRRTVADGRRSLGVAGNGALAVGAPADFAVLDLDRLDRDALVPVAPTDLLFARGTASHVRDVYVAGNRIVADGAVTGIDLDAVETELRALYRANSRRFAALDLAWPHLRNGIEHWFAARGMQCC